MPVYVCRKDGTDLTEEVKRALDDPGPGYMGVDVLVEGSPEEGDAPSNRESFLGAIAAEEQDGFIVVVVTCPTDDAPNRFVVRRREG